MLPSTDLIVAGAGPSGLSAAINAASEGIRVTMIDPGTIGGSARWSTAIENVAGFPSGITGKDYGRRAYRQARKFGARMIEDRIDTFCRLQDGTIAVQLESARLIECRSLVLATGTAPKPLTVPGGHAFGVFRGANPDDLARWAGREIALVGAGNSAGQAAVAFAREGAKVTLYARRSLTETMSQYLIDRLSQHITIRQTEVNAIERRDDQLWIGPNAFDAIFTFVGSAPIHEFPVSCDDHAFVLADRFSTSMRGVFAIGDVRAGSVKRIASAVGEGAAVIASVHSHIRESR